MEERPPYEKGILATLKWGMEANIPLQEIPCEANWCGSGYKCYYGGVIPGHFQAQEAATNFVMSSISKVTTPNNPNKPLLTQMTTDSFFIILIDIRKEDDIKTHFFFYDGIETIKNMKRHKIALKEFTIENIGEYRKPWQKVNLVQIDMVSRELYSMFKDFLEKVKLQQKQNEEHTHEDNCECCEKHDAPGSTGNNESGD